MPSARSPGGPYWHTYVGHPQPALAAQPSRVVARHTTCVKWPVAVLQPGLPKSYNLTSSYQASTAAAKLACPLGVEGRAQV